jgi:hypothetical protein
MTLPEDRFGHRPSVGQIGLPMTTRVLPMPLREGAGDLIDGRAGLQQSVDEGAPTMPKT